MITLRWHKGTAALTGDPPHGEATLKVHTWIRLTMPSHTHGVGTRRPGKNTEIVFPQASEHQTQIGGDLNDPDAINQVHHIGFQKNGGFQA